jgi:hypothetical protein
MGCVNKITGERELQLSKSLTMYTSRKSSLESLETKTFFGETVHTKKRPKINKC